VFLSRHNHKIQYAPFISKKVIFPVGPAEAPLKEESFQKFRFSRERLKKRQGFSRKARESSLHNPTGFPMKNKRYQFGYGNFRHFALPEADGRAEARFFLHFPVACA